PRLLIIEEDDQLREMMQLMALRSGYRAETAGSAEEGLPIFMNGTFDLVLVDFGMPGMDGCEFARRIKASSPNTPVCLTTGLEKDDIPVPSMPYCSSRSLSVNSAALYANS
ncbi:MAG: response regulator, partial [Deltaproteobacteria bacterium]|nr:response regulator [Deltaproteobacteria bacterium]